MGALVSLVSDFSVDVQTELQILAGFSEMSLLSIDQADIAQHLGLAQCAFVLTVDFQRRLVGPRCLLVVGLLQFNRPEFAQPISLQNCQLLPFAALGG